MTKYHLYAKNIVKVNENSTKVEKELIAYNKQDRLRQMYKGRNESRIKRNNSKCPKEHRKRPGYKNQNVKNKST
jgi:hypothetical protein